MATLPNAAIEAANMLARIKAQRDKRTGILYSNFTGTHVDARESVTDPIITEDIECEIVDPKQLPASK